MTCRVTLVIGAPLKALTGDRSRAELLLLSLLNILPYILYTHSLVRLHTHDTNWSALKTKTKLETSGKEERRKEAAASGEHRERAFIRNKTKKASTTTREAILCCCCCCMYKYILGKVPLSGVCPLLHFYFIFSF